MKIAFLDDYHEAYRQTKGVRRLSDVAEVQIFTKPVSDFETLRGYEALVATRERTRLDAPTLIALPDVRIVAQTGNHAYHVDLEAAQQRGLVIAKATGGFCTSAGN